MGYSSGAPDAACSTITPGHGTSQATDPVPFNVDISSLDGGYIPGQTYTIVLSGSDSNSDFKGFLIQGRMMADNSPVGTFVDNGNNQQIRCSSSAAIHTSSVQKTTVQLRWTAPAMDTGAILFRYAFVDSRTVYWPNQATNTVQEGVPPDIDEGPFIPLPYSLTRLRMTVKIGSPVYVVDGFNVIINCNILTGTPPVTILWFRNGVLDLSLGSNNSVTINDARDGDVFTCRADNIIGQDNETSIIYVFEPPEILPIPIPTAPPGGTTVSTGVPSVTPIDTGSSVTVYCPSSGVHTPTIIWFKDGTRITSGDRFTISATILGTEAITSVLMIDNFQPEDVGTYSCESINRVDSATGSTNLTQQLCPACPPSAVVSPDPNSDECPICGIWITGPFGKCSLSCHSGIRSRTVACINFITNETLSDIFCDPDTKPAVSMRCGRGPCPKWKKGPWSECSKTCQTGIRTRRVECKLRGSVVSATQCKANSRPKSTGNCNARIKCPKNCSIIMINGSVKHKRRQRKTTLKFSSNADRGATSKCKLDAKEFIDCTSPVVWRELSKGNHTVIVTVSCIENQTTSMVGETFQFQIQ